MPKRKYPTDVIRQSKEVLSAWNQFTPLPIFGPLTVDNLDADLTVAADIQAQIVSLETQLTDKRNLRDAQLAALWDKIKRVRNAVKGIYGDDSSQYEMVGGTRMSERKPSRRKNAG